MARTWQNAALTIDGETYFPGQVAVGEHWNGFSIPRFTRAVAEDILDTLGGDGSPQSYEIDRDGVLTVWLEGEVEQTVSPDADGLYTLGAWSWVWDEGTDEIDYAHAMKRHVIRRSLRAEKAFNDGEMDDEEYNGIIRDVEVALGRDAIENVAQHMTGNHASPEDMLRMADDVTSVEFVLAVAEGREPVGRR